mmetsp:Transcript_7752/g.13761  ORF Transcript_7752/g.13761 Transcript_7752/m.13761 type:complete len:240 (+) Transcript_7752:86-805(+)
MATKPFAQMVHPNAVVARREMERQEQNRLRRLNEVKTNTPGSAGPPRAGSAGRHRPGGPRSRPPSAPAMRSSSSSASAGSAGRPGGAARPRPPPALAPDEVQQHLLKHQLGPYQVAAAAAASAANSARRSRSDTGPRIQPGFLTSPQRRFDDAQNSLPANSEAERKALMEELQSWYFSMAPEGGEEMGARAAHAALPPRPPVMLLEEAAAAIKAKQKDGYVGVREWSGLSPAGQRAHFS